MTHTIARLVLGMLMLPFSVLFLAGSMALLAYLSGGPGPRGWEVFGAWMATDLFVTIYWIAVWRSAIRWSRPRVIHTVGTIGLGLALSFMAIAILRNILGAPLEPTMLFSNAFYPIVFVLGTTLAWRETAEERVARLSARGPDTVACPLCGYNMTGLRQTRCPECGTEFTLDALLTAQGEADR